MPLSRNLRLMDAAYEGQLLVDASNQGREIGSNIAETVNVGNSIIRYGTFVCKNGLGAGQVLNAAPGLTVVGVSVIQGVNQRHPILDATGRISYESGILPRQPVSVLTTGIVYLLTEGTITRGQTNLQFRTALNTAGVNNFARLGRISATTDGLAGSTYTSLGTTVTALDAGTAGQIIRFAINIPRVNLLF